MLLNDKPIKEPIRELITYTDTKGNEIVSDCVDKWALISGEWFLVEDGMPTKRAVKH